MPGSTKPPPVATAAHGKGRATTARELYDDYWDSVQGVSPFTCAPLPPFERCPAQVRHALEHVARRAADRAGFPPGRTAVAEPTG